MPKYYNDNNDIQQGQAFHNFMSHIVPIPTYAHSAASGRK